MMNIDKIVFPVDLTEATNQTVPYVRTMASRLKAIEEKSRYLRNVLKGVIDWSLYADFGRFNIFSRF